MKNDHLRAGELARLAGVSTDTLHHYERVGVLPEIPREANGYRLYPPDLVERLIAIRRAMELGFTLKELAQFFKARASGRLPCREVRATAAARLEQVREQRQALELLEGELEKMLALWDARLSTISSTVPAGLIENLSKDNGSSKTRRGAISRSTKEKR